MICGVCDKNRVNILLAHNPNDFDVYKKWGADLVFSGHTHGGMVRIFDRGLLSTDRTFYPEYDGGVYKIISHPDMNSLSYITNEKKYSFIIIDTSTMFVSRGLSRGHIGFRLFNTPELIYITFN